MIRKNIKDDKVFAKVLHMRIYMALNGTASFNRLLKIHIIKTKGVNEC